MLDPNLGSEVPSLWATLGLRGLSVQRVVTIAIATIACVMMATATGCDGGDVGVGPRLMRQWWREGGKRAPGGDEEEKAC
ncbi:hypothetical protein NL676_037807 [Syzygium grande]|nr:hypothetical protein NL676_037807 [Syzygium grande]